MSRSRIQEQTDLTSRCRCPDSDIVAILTLRQNDGIQLQRSAGPGWAHSKFFGHATARGIPPIDDFGPRLFSKQHQTSNRALAPAFDRCHLECSNRFPTMCLQTLSRRRIRPAIRVCGRGRSAIGPCWFRSGGCRTRRLLPELRPTDDAVRPIREDAEEGTTDGSGPSSAERNTGGDGTGIPMLAREGEGAVGKQTGASALLAAGSSTSCRPSALG